MTSGVELAKKGQCEYCQQPTFHGPWTEQQIDEVVSDLGITPDEFGDCCDDCFLVDVARGDIASAQQIAERSLELRKSEHLARQQKHEKFLAAGRALQDFRAAHPDDYRTHPESAALFDELLKHAPPEVLQAFRDKAKECDLLPETKFVNDAGEPVYSAEQIAEKFGVPVEQVERELREKFGDKLEAGNVHPVQ